jgi:hypothetical protein
MLATWIVFMPGTANPVVVGGSTAHALAFWPLNAHQDSLGWLLSRRRPKGPGSAPFGRSFSQNQIAAATLEFCWTWLNPVLATVA